jgi:hypothetical protein
MTESGIRHPPEKSAASSDARSARPSPRAQREYFLDQLYLVLKERADRRQHRDDRRVLDRADDGRRPVNQRIAGSGADVERQSDWQILKSVEAPVGGPPPAEGGEPPRAEVGEPPPAEVPERPLAEGSEPPLAEVGGPPRAEVGRPPRAGEGEPPLAEIGDRGSCQAAIRAARSTTAEPDTTAPPADRDELAQVIGLWSRLHWPVKAGMAALLLVGVLVAVYQLMVAPTNETDPSRAKRAPIAANGTSPGGAETSLRTLRRRHIEQLATAPEIVLLGGDHWREARGSLLPRRWFYNAHIGGAAFHHDLLALAEVLIREDRLPQIMIIGIDAATFLPVEQRAHHRWRTALPDFRAMAERLGLADVDEGIGAVAEDGWLARVGLDALWTDPAPSIAPEASAGPIMPASALGLLGPDGSLRPLVTHPQPPGRPSPGDPVEMALDAWRPPAIELEAVRAVDRLIGFLIERGVRVVLANPPLHPLVYREVANGPSAEGLGQIEAMTARLAEAHGTLAVGSFDPAWVGCDAGMFIDAEHGDAECLELVFDQIPRLWAPPPEPSPEQEELDQLDGADADPAATGAGGTVEPGDDAVAIGR